MIGHSSVTYTQEQRIPQEDTQDVSPQIEDRIRCEMDHVLLDWSLGGVCYNGIK